MKRSTRNLLLLAACVAVLAAAAWWQARSERQSLPGTLTSLDPASITRVDVTFGQNATEHYVKRDGHWWHVDHAQNEAADELRLNELTHIAAAPVDSWQVANTYDPARIGLSPPQVTLVLDGQAIRFGGMTAIGQDMYAQVGGRVGILSLRYLPRSAQSHTIKAF